MPNNQQGKAKSIQTDPDMSKLLVLTNEVFFKAITTRFKYLIEKLNILSEQMGEN